MGELDENGFVIDFGKLGFLKEWFKSYFDHTLVLSKEDPLQHRYMDDENVKLVIVPDCSAEGLAKYIFMRASDIVTDRTAGRVLIQKVTVYEDSKNSATYVARNL
jgi:6-pyruvoyltetrahydropterin/6-carboxytetrahydropterin synthase